MTLNVTSSNHGVSAEEFNCSIGECEKEEIRLAAGASSNDLLILFVGPRVQRKGLDISIESSSQADLRYKLV